MMEPELSNVVNAVAAILKQDNRAVAVQTTKLPCHQLVQHVPLSVSHYVYVTQDGELHFNKTNYKDHSIAVPEPITNTGTKQHPQNYVTPVITKGTSHFDLISCKNWDCLEIWYVFTLVTLDFQFTQYPRGRMHYSIILEVFTVPHIFLASPRGIMQSLHGV